MKLALAQRQNSALTIWQSGPVGDPDSAMSFQMLAPKTDTREEFRKKVGNTMKASVARNEQVVESPPEVIPAGPR